MARVKRGVTAHAKHKKVLDQAKGYYGRRKNTIRIAKQAVEKANQYAYRDRKNRKRNFRALWIQRINAASRELGPDLRPPDRRAEPRRHRGRPQGALRSRDPRAGGLRRARRAGQGGARLPEGQDAGRARQGGRRESCVGAAATLSRGRGCRRRRRVRGSRPSELSSCPGLTRASIPLRLRPRPRPFRNGLPGQVRQ